MIRDLRQHSSHYAILAGWLGLMWLLWLGFRGNQEMAGMVIGLTGLGYVAWGVGHHYKMGDLSAKIVAEYVLMAMVVVIVLVMAMMNR